MCIRDSVKTPKGEVLIDYRSQNSTPFPTKNIENFDNFSKTASLSQKWTKNAMSLQAIAAKHERSKESREGAGNSYHHHSKQRPYVSFTFQHASSMPASLPTPSGKNSSSRIGTADMQVKSNAASPTPRHNGSTITTLTNYMGTESSTLVQSEHRGSRHVKSPSLDERPESQSQVSIANRRTMTRVTFSTIGTLESARGNEGREDDIERQDHHNSSTTNKKNNYNMKRQPSKIAKYWGFVGETPTREEKETISTLYDKDWRKIFDENNELAWMNQDVTLDQLKDRILENRFTIRENHFQDYSYIMRATRDNKSGGQRPSYGWRGSVNGLNNSGMSAEAFQASLAGNGEESMHDNKKGAEDPFIKKVIDQALTVVEKDFRLVEKEGATYDDLKVSKRVPEPEGETENLTKPSVLHGHHRHRHRKSVIGGLRPPKPATWMIDEEHRKKYKRLLTKLKTLLMLMNRSKISIKDLAECRVFGSRPFERPGSWEFIRAAKRGDWKTIGKMLRANRYYVFDYDHIEQTALHWASKRGDVEIVRMLLEHGANVNSTDLTEKNALHYAIREGHVEVVKCLLYARASPWGIAKELLSSFKILYYVQRARKIHIALQLSTYDKRDAIWQKEAMVFLYEPPTTKKDA
eukprot:TRINITY_DN11729_c0_g1_i4.p1 TRINITY_DN11729_c0_g1~~TRINITY_DN11729_c0_g1_i4.p1  ORF type:complete len:636 (+),score=71.87 TRINITY_DN11729_c0_g1_i4:81-1988(+)